MPNRYVAGGDRSTNAPRRGSTAWGRIFRSNPLCRYDSHSRSLRRAGRVSVRLHPPGSNSGRFAMSKFLRTRRRKHGAPAGESVAGTPWGREFDCPTGRARRGRRHRTPSCLLETFDRARSSVGRHDGPPALAGADDCLVSLTSGAQLQSLQGIVAAPPGREKNEGSDAICQF